MHVKGRIIAMNPEALKRHAIQEDKGMVSVGGLVMRLGLGEESIDVFQKVIQYLKENI